jgi:hypothetical protein
MANNGEEEMKRREWVAQTDFRLVGSEKAQLQVRFRAFGFLGGCRNRLSVRQQKVERQ